MPTPTLCPEERQRRRLAWRNDRNYFRSTCEATGKSVITNYNPNAYKVYDNKVWRSDTWDPLDYGRDFDTQQSFFAQYHSLEKVIPHMALRNDDGQGSENCIYTYDILNCKDSYMISQSLQTRNGFYATEASDSTDIAE